MRNLLVGIAIGLVSLSCGAQAAPAAGGGHPPLATSLGVAMNYWSGDWGKGDINRWGPTVWGTATIWHDLSFIAESHTMITGGNSLAHQFKYFTGGGGLVYTTDYWGRFQPSFKAEAGFASLSHPGNGTGHLHDTSHIWTYGVGVEYHTAGKWWTRVEYDYDFFPNFRNGFKNKVDGLNPHGFTFGEVYRFGPTGGSF